MAFVVATLALFVFPFVAIVLGIEPVIHKYDYVSSDGGFEAFECPEKGRGFESVVAAFNDYRNASGHTHVILWRKSTRQWWRFWRWLDYLVHDRWNCPVATQPPGIQALGIQEPRKLDGPSEPAGPVCSRSHETRVFRTWCTGNSGRVQPLAGLPADPGSRHGCCFRLTFARLLPTRKNGERPMKRIPEIAANLIGYEAPQRITGSSLAPLPSTDQTEGIASVHDFAFVLREPRVLPHSSQIDLPHETPAFSRAFQSYRTFTRQHSSIRL